MRKDNDVIDCIGPLHAENEIELLWPNWSSTVIMKTRQGNDVIDRTSAIYVEIKIEQSWSIRQDTIYYKK